ncbi:MAG: thermostable hemolysin, partial [Woeseiaceae bacterium]
ALSFDLVGEKSTERAALESCITEKFERVYGAHLTHFLPQLLRLGVAEELGAVAGIRSAHSNELFLEQYLDVPVEQAIARVFQGPVDRAQVVEIGNLAAKVPGFAYALFAVLATVLSRAGYRWVACTATPQVAAMLKRMNFASQPICSANPEKLQADASDWGDYYASRPRVIVGDVRRAAAEVAQDPEMATLIRRFVQPVRNMAASLKRNG